MLNSPLRRLLSALRPRLHADAAPLDSAARSMPASTTRELSRTWRLCITSNLAARPRSLAPGVRGSRSGSAVGVAAAVAAAAAEAAHCCGSGSVAAFGSAGDASPLSSSQEDGSDETGGACVRTPAAPATAQPPQVSTSAQLWSRCPPVEQRRRTLVAECAHSASADVSSTVPNSGAGAWRMPLVLPIRRWTVT